MARTSRPHRVRPGRAARRVRAVNPSNLRGLARDVRPLWLAPGRLGLFRITDGHLFEIDRDTWEMFAALSRGEEPGPEAAEVLATARASGLLVETASAHPVLPSLPPPAAPYLRYLNLQLTHRCHLRCAHCYHGSALDLGISLDTELVLATLRTFAELGGLVVAFSGGEPSLHPDFWRLNAALPGLGLRAELFTNGLGIPPARVPELAFHRVRVSLDGLAPGHEALRGRGSFAPALRFARAVRDAGRALEVSTMLHTANRDELLGLEELVRDQLHAAAWRVGSPFPRGHWKDSTARLGLDEAATGQLSARFPGYGDAGFVSDDRPACDAEMLTIDADGSVGSCAMLPETFRWSLTTTPLAHIWTERSAVLSGEGVQSLACRARCFDPGSDRGLPV